MERRKITRHSLTLFQTINQNSKLNHLNLCTSACLSRLCMCASPAAVSRAIFFWSGNWSIAPFMWRCCGSLSRLLTITEPPKEAKSKNEYSSIIAHGSMHVALNLTICWLFIPWIIFASLINKRLSSPLSRRFAYFVVNLICKWRRVVASCEISHVLDMFRWMRDKVTPARLFLLPLSDCNMRMLHEHRQ